MNSISFFIPAYNCSTTITESVESILATNFADGDELIIVNDCSTDDTAAILTDLQHKYPQIKIITHLRNKGGAAARNTAVEHAQHHLLFCLDSDNVLEHDSIKPLVSYLVTHNAEIACFKELKYFSVSTKTTDESWYFEPSVFTIQHLLSGKLPPGASGNYLFTKNSWLKANGYSEDMGALDTWSFGFKQLIEGCKTVVMPDSYYFHRRGHNSYYIRDAWNKRRSVSLRLIKLVITYIDRLNPDDVNYIFSKKGRYSWFDNLEKHPIRLIDMPAKESVWDEHTLKLRPIKQLNHRIVYYKNRISGLLKRK